MSYANLTLMTGNYCTIYIDGRAIEGQIENLGPVVCTVITDEGAAMVTTAELEEWCEAPIGSTESLLKAAALTTLERLSITVSALKTTIEKAREGGKNSQANDPYSRGIDDGLIVGLNVAVEAIERVLK